MDSADNYSDRPIHRRLSARFHEQYARKMLIAYVDESFSEGHYFMGALVLAPKDVGQLARSLHDLMEEVARENPEQIDGTEEFHGSDLWGGKGVWRKDIHSPNLRISWL